ncbi:MAG: TRAM domain-containing protein [Bacillota bacterium]|nr:TRAM domain-containing protein [Bacillota bacterium]
MVMKYISMPLLLFALIFGLWVGYTTKMYFGGSPMFYGAVGLASFLIGYISAGWFLHKIYRALKKLNRFLDSTSIEILVGGTAGLLLGVLVGFLTSYPLSLIRPAGIYLTIAMFILCAYLGCKVGVRRAPDVWDLLPLSNHEMNLEKTEIAQKAKVLDTSAIIDGRIYDVCLTKFLEGLLIVPVFVIEELQHIADSSDNLRRNKGRRGLELLSKMQKHPSIKIDIIEENIPEEKEVDMKLLRLCKQMDANIITNDYNLNKVAELQGITVLNINELTNAVKVVVYPGETMHIHVLKEGKEPGQGVGYLDDGTMVVVEDAQDELGKNLEVLVTSVFQTAAGRMIFTRKVREDPPVAANHTLQGVQMQEVKVFG